MSERSDSIRVWLLKSPRPANVTVNLRDGDAEQISTTGKLRWRDVAETIDALDPASLHAMSDDGKLIRALRLGDAAVSVQAAEPEAETPVLPSIPGMPMLPTELAADPQALMMAYYATLLDRAYQFSIQTSNQTMLSVIELINRRSEAIETRLERTERNLRQTMEERYEDAWEHLQDTLEQASAEDGDGKDAILRAFLEGQVMQKQPVKRPPPNGKGRPS